jgi:putative restriction endonuclease
MELGISHTIQIETKTVNYVDSAVSNRLKLKDYRGVGEKRIYITNTSDPSVLDNFFFKDTNGIFFILKQDLLIYLRDAYMEFHYPISDYKENIRGFYHSLMSLVNSLPERFEVSFTQTYDSQKRYYIKTERSSRELFNVIGEICLPRVTKLSFVKLYDPQKKVFSIQLRPFFFRTDLTSSHHPNFYKAQNLPDYTKGLGSETAIIEPQLEIETVDSDIIDEDIITEESSSKRPWQQEWRSLVLEDTMHCAVTKCSEDRILIGCHIKPVKYCLKEKCGNEKNPKNGIMMTPTFHKLFDDGFLSFDDTNRILLSSHISKTNFKRLGVEDRQMTSILSIDARKEFLNWHRVSIFKG